MLGTNLLDVDLELLCCPYADKLYSYSKFQQLQNPLLGTNLLDQDYILIYNAQPTSSSELP